MRKITIGGVILLSLLSGCAHLDFGEDGLTYYDPKPYLFVTTAKDCKYTATVVIVPGTKKAVKFKSGYGTANLSVSLNDGMITTAGQITDTQIPATIGQITGLTTAAAGLMKATRVKLPGEITPGEITPKECTPTALLYPIVSGVVEDKPISFPVNLIQ